MLVRHLLKRMAARIQADSTKQAGKIKRENK
jgi:hypothetical protein